MKHGEGIATSIPSLAFFVMTWVICKLAYAAPGTFQDWTCHKLCPLQLVVITSWDAAAVYSACCLLRQSWQEKVNIDSVDKLMDQQAELLSCPLANSMVMLIHLF